MTEADTAQIIAFLFMAAVAMAAMISAGAFIVLRTGRCGGEPHQWGRWGDREIERHYPGRLGWSFQRRNCARCNREQKRYY